MDELASVVIPNWNRHSETLECIKSVLLQDYASVEVIVVDNGSTDGSVEAIKKIYPKVKVVENKTNQGFARASNQGIRESKGEYVLTLNNDAVAEKNWITELVKASESRKDVGMCASKMVFMQDESTINSTGIIPFKTGYAIDRGFGERDKGQYELQEEVFGPCAGAALYRRDALEDVKLDEMYFDEDYFCYSEDADLAWRMQLAGWKCRYVPTAKVRHTHSSTSIEGSALKTYYMKRNSFATTIKNSSTKNLILYAPFIAAYNAVVFPFYLMMGGGSATAFAKAVVDTLLSMKRTLEKRRRIQPQRKAESKDVDKWFKNPENPLTALKRNKFAQGINK